MQYLITLAIRSVWFNSGLISNSEGDFRSKQTQVLFLTYFPMAKLTQFIAEFGRVCIWSFVFDDGEYLQSPNVGARCGSSLAGKAGRNSWECLFGI